jgi:hypothetical protein
MIIFGHRFITSESFYHVLDIDSIKHTPSSSTIYIEFNEDNLDIIQHAQLNSVDMTIQVSNITELIYASALDAKYIAVSKKDAKEFQDIAENYLFDAKILVMIDNEKEIEEIALLGIDGILCSNAILKINS